MCGHFRITMGTPASPGSHPSQRCLGDTEIKMKLPLLFGVGLAVASSTGFSAPVRPQRDVSADVLAAISAGMSSYTLPAGEVMLRSPIIIPPGTRGFSLLGGAGGTTLRTPSHMDRQAIRIGNRPELSDNWWITGPNNISIGAVPEGQDWVQSAEPVPLGYAVLWDHYKIVCAKGPNVSMNHAELVKVVSYDQTTGKAMLDAKVGRDYAAPASLCPYEGATCANIKVQGISFDGATMDGSNTSEGLLMLGIADNVQLIDLHAKNFRSDAIATNTARNVSVTNCSVQGASEGGAGAGYGFSIYRSRHVVLQGDSATGCRHGILLHSGTMDVQIRSCTTPNGFDLHGYDERRVDITDCSGDGLDVGNDAWLGGAKDVHLTHCNITGDVGFHAGTGIVCTDCQFGAIGLYSVEAGTTPTVGIPAAEQVGDLTLVGCTMTSGGSCVIDQGAQRYGTVAFRDCKFRSKSTSLDLSYSGAGGSLAFTGCTFYTGSVDHVVQFHGMPKGTVSLDKCTLKGRGALAIWVKDDVRANVKITACRYIGGPNFIADDSKRVKCVGDSAGK